MSEPRTAVANERVAVRWPFFAVSGALFVLLMGANLPTALYAVYRQAYGFSGTVLTLIFASYAVVLIPSLLLFGQLSDRIGRRRVILLGLATAAVALLVFAAAAGTAWLFAARAVQGVAVRATTGTAIAALVELEPGGDPPRAALFATPRPSRGRAPRPVLAGVPAQGPPAPPAPCHPARPALTPPP